MLRAPSQNAACAIFQMRGSRIVRIKVAVSLGVIPTILRTRSTKHANSSVLRALSNQDDLPIFKFLRSRIAVHQII